MGTSWTQSTTAAKFKRKSTAIQAVCRHYVNKIVKLWGPVEHWTQISTPNICRCWKKTTNIYIFQNPFSPCWGPGLKKLFWSFFLSTGEFSWVQNFRISRHPQQVFLQIDRAFLTNIPGNHFSHNILAVFYHSDLKFSNLDPNWAKNRTLL